VAELLASVLGSAGAGLAGQLVVLLVPAVLLVVAALALRRLRGSVRQVAVTGDEAGMTRTELVARGKAARAAGDHVAAVRAGYAVLVIDLVARGVLEAPPGTTVGEVGRAVAVGLPAAASLVNEAGSVLAGAVYGDGTADAAGVEVVARAGRAVAAGRPGVTAPGAHR
jgi:hypothetical protein